MKYSEKVANRLYLWAIEQATLQNKSIDTYVSETLHCSIGLLRRVCDGEKSLPFSVCDLAIENGLEPSYLFLGAPSERQYDSKRCFSHGEKNTCRVLNVKKCEGYDKCKFYKSEEEYMLNMI